MACSQSFGWGAKGHEVVSYVGGQITYANGAAFWQANVDGLRQLSTVPDRVWKAPSTKANEGYNHFFQADSYFTDPTSAVMATFPKAYTDAVNRYGETAILKNGTGPWRVVELYQLAMNSFRQGDTKSGLEYAGTMSHYIGDMSQPLHVAENYDGQETGQTGIHAWFETKNIEDEMSIRAEVGQRAEALLRDPNFTQQFNGDLMDILYNEISRSVAKRDELLANDKQYGRSGQGKQVQLNLAEDRMADGAATLAVILTHLAQDGAIADNATPVPIDDPQWVPNLYQGNSNPAAPASPMMTSLVQSPMEDDCAQL